MASRVLGFFLGLLFMTLAVVPFLPIDIDLVNQAIDLVFNSYMLGPIPVVSLILALIGIFCFQSAVRDVWPFYG